MNSGRCLAMWSGPRNISTAMMRAWENRPDTQVVDEPFYAHYLQATGIDHPLADSIIAMGETDWQCIVDRLVKRPSSGYFYQKHMTVHWLDHFSTDWLARVEHVFLIRPPEPVIASYIAKRGTATATDLGYARQASLFDTISAQNGEAPPVIDSERFLRDPEGQLRTLCERLSIAFDAAMLSWPTGSRESDGIWGTHWYDAVNRSTGFAAPRTLEPVALSASDRHLADSCRPDYDRLAEHAIETPADPSIASR